MFQSTLPRGERRFGVGSLFDYFGGFNPRSREGSDKDGRILYIKYLDVSIHAPARGATYSSMSFSSNTTVSIHAPARGATTLYFSDKVTSNCFNPRSREGSDQ